MTTNLGAGSLPLSDTISPLFSGDNQPFPVSKSFDREAYKKQIMDAIRLNLRPELVNRISNIVLFYPLSCDDIRKVIDKILALSQKQLKDQQMTIEISDAVYDILMQEGYNATYGAREMERAIQRLIVQPLGKAILSGQVSSGETIPISVEGGEIRIQSKTKGSI